MVLLGVGSQVLWVPSATGCTAGSMVVRLLSDLLLVWAWVFLGAVDGMAHQGC